jgi:integrase/recombinase XerC
MRPSFPSAQPQEVQIIDEYLTHMRRAGATEKTLDERYKTLHRLNREMPHGIGRVSTEELARWIHRDGLAQNSKVTYYNALRSFYGWAADPADPWIDADPTEKLEHVTRPQGVARPVTDEELRALLARAREPYRTWAILAAYQGLRCVEISRLDREHVTERQLFVLQGKGNKPRVHDTDPTVWATVRDRGPGPLAIVMGRRATAKEVSVRAALHFQRTLKLDGVSMHRLRHWLGVTVQREFKDIRVTQAVLGHSALSSTMIYTQASDEQQRAARATLPRFA